MKNKTITIRVTEEDRGKIQLCCEKTGMTQYDVIMCGVEKIYKQFKCEKNEVYNYKTE